MPRRIPDDWTVWAFSDAHGVLDGLVESLYRAGLIDELGHWSAAPATALVGVGDYVDRGPDSAGVVKFLSRLSAAAAAAASRVILVRGNHEQMLLELLRGDPGCFLSWMSNGGRAFLASYGHPDPKFGPPLATLLDTEANGLMDWLSATLPYAVWGDVLLVHASPVAGGRLATLEEGDQQMWSAAQYLQSGGPDPRYAGYREDGISRIVVGHVPQDDGPTLTHDGTTLLLDSNASGMRRSDGRTRGGCSSIVRLALVGSPAGGHLCSSARHHGAHNIVHPVDDPR